MFVSCTHFSCFIKMCNIFFVLSIHNLLKRSFESKILNWAETLKTIFFKICKILGIFDLETFCSGKSKCKSLNAQTLDFDFGHQTLTTFKHYTPTLDNGHQLRTPSISEVDVRTSDTDIQTQMIQSFSIKCFALCLTSAIDRLPASN